MITLAIESSSGCGSMAVVENSAVVFDERFGSDRRHSSDLFLALERALVRCDSLDQVAVGLGPGAYSGVRVAIAAAIGIGIARKCKLVGLPSVTAFELEEYLAVGDARRSGFYFTHVRAGECVQGPVLADEQTLLRLVESPLPILASGPVLALPTLQIAFPCARKLAVLAQSGLGMCARGELEPIYLREALVTPPAADTPRLR